MVNLSVADAVALVRKNLDEQDPNGSFMYDENGSTSDFGDNESLDNLIERNLPEAINAVHKAAPVHLLEGHDLDKNDDIASTPAADIDSDNVLSFTLKDTTNYLRLVAFRATDSDIVVTNAIPEASPEGRKQLNKYIRGRKDRPRLVQLQGKHNGPSFMYYSLGQTYNPVSGAIAAMTFVQEQQYNATTSATSYPISSRLRQNIIDYLTAMVMETFGMQNTQAYYQKANTYPSL